HALHRNSKQSNLNRLPLPATATLGIVEFDLLHAVNQLYHTALVAGGLIEALVIEEGAALHEGTHPEGVEQRAQGKQSKDAQVVISQYHGEREQVECRKQHRQAG